MVGLLTGTNVQFTRRLNRRVVIEAIRRNGSASRADIAQQTGLTHQAVSNIVAGLVREGFLVEQGRREVDRGQPPVLYAVDPNAAHAIGINLDRDRLVGVRIDLDGAVTRRIEKATDYPDPQRAMELIARTARTLAEAAPRKRERILGVGLALPTGKWIDPADFPGWRSPEVRDELQQKLGLPLYVENDATVSAIWERLYGRGREFENFFYIHFGRALGGGVISDGEPLYGAHGNAGEFGFTPVYPDAAAFRAGRSEPLQQHVSLATLERDLGSPVDERTDPTRPEVAGWLERAARLLRDPILAIDNLFDPDAIFLGGRLPAAIREALVHRLEPDVLRLRVPGKTYPVHLLPGEAAEDAAALGAATLLMYEALAPAPDLVRKRVAAQ